MIALPVIKRDDSLCVIECIFYVMKGLGVVSAIILVKHYNALQCPSDCLSTDTHHVRNNPSCEQCPTFTVVHVISINAGKLNIV